MVPLLVCTYVTLAACSNAGPTVSVPYRQSFDAPLGPEWQGPTTRWRVVDGRLFNDGSHNVPLWLSLALPDDVAISFTAASHSAAVDFKVELFGNGRDHESGYIVVFGGWNNTTSLIARRDEHGPRRSPERTQALVEAVTRDAIAAGREGGNRRETVARSTKLEVGRAYRVRLERRGGWLKAFLDDELLLEYFDPAPLGGAGQDRFAFSNWASVVTFDELVIEALAPSP